MISRFKRNVIGAAMVGLAVLAAPAVTATSAQAAAGSDHLNRGESLYPGQSIRWLMPTGYTSLIMQTDGNLVEYTASGHVCFAANTQWNGSYAIYQTDGNFVVYDSGHHALWASGSQDDGGTTVNINAYGGLWAGETQITQACHD